MQLEIQAADGTWEPVPVTAEHGSTSPGTGGPITPLSIPSSGVIALGQAALGANAVIKEIISTLGQLSSAQYRGGKAARRMLRAGRRS